MAKNGHFCHFWEILLLLALFQDPFWTKNSSIIEESQNSQSSHNLIWCCFNFSAFNPTLPHPEIGRFWSFCLTLAFPKCPKKVSFRQVSRCLFLSYCTTLQLFRRRKYIWDSPMVLKYKVPWSNFYEVFLSLKLTPKVALARETKIIKQTTTSFFPLTSAAFSLFSKRKDTVGSHEIMADFVC